MLLSSGSPAVRPRVGLRVRAGALPLVRIDHPAGHDPEYRAGVADVVYRALVEAAGAPEHDRFLIITEHAPGTLDLDPRYPVERTPEALVVQITLNQGRTLDVKKAFYRAIAGGLHERVGLRIEDVVIDLVEVPMENWSFGRGEAQYAS